MSISLRGTGQLKGEPSGKLIPGDANMINFNFERLSFETEFQRETRPPGDVPG